MKIRFLADADLNQAIVIGLLRREPLIDFLSAHDAGLRGRSDPAVLAIAARQNRVLVSHDSGTMPVHFAEYVANGNHCPGLLVVPQRVAIGVAIDELLLIWKASEAEEWNDRLAWLPF